MLEQHPVPQNVTSFQFRLIGDMTLKQFGYLAGGALLAYIAYHLPLPFFFTWPLTAIFVLGGIGFAFVPVEERPMDVWFLSFIKSVYSPTLYIWQRENPSLSKSPAGLNSLIPPLPLPVIGKPPTSAGALPQKSTSSTSKNLWETFFVKKTKTAASFPTSSATVSNIGTSVLASTPVTPPATLPQKQSPTPVAPEQMKPVVHPQTSPAPAPREKPSEPDNTQKQSPLEKQLAEALNDKKRLEDELASIKQMLMSQQKAPTPPPSPTDKPVNNPFLQRNPPNVITGTVRQSTGELLHSILVTVKDKDDIPLRALKTNKMGQFASSTPLPNGTYTVDIEDPKGMFFFQPIKMTLEGKSLEPVIIAAKTKQDLDRQKLADALFGKKD